jgi:hypothetical protein
MATRIIGHAKIEIDDDGNGTITLRSDTDDSCAYPFNVNPPQFGDYDDESLMRSALNFLAACGESLAYEQRTGKPCEDSDLFEREVAEWAAVNVDELWYEETEET